jgi:raffinose/stachyose/melibiose transport system substrate-binding protein
MKKMISVLLVISILVVLVGCGGSETETNDANSSTDSGASNETSNEDASDSSKSSSIRIINGKIEIDGALQKYAKAYEEKNGVEVIIESIGGGADIGATIKGYFAAGNMPDIFVFGGEGEFLTWEEHMEDLSDEIWASDTAVAYTSPDGKVVGFPYAVEGYGLTYNKDILDAADVDPEGLTNINAYRDAFQKIETMKDELGLTSVVSMAAEAGQMYWSTGNHNFGTYLSTGLEQGDTKYIDMLKNGEIDKERMTQYGEFVQLLFDHSDRNTLLSGTYDDQLALWAQGKTAFVHQGNWIDPSLPDYGVEFAMGISPLAFMEEDTDGILADAPSWWALYNGGENVQEAKDFLESLATTDEGAQALVIDAGMISPFKSTTIEPVSPLAVDLMGWVQEGKTYSWQWAKMPEGFAMNDLGPVFEAYARGDVDVEGFVELMESAIGTLK